METLLFARQCSSFFVCCQQRMYLCWSSERMLRGGGQGEVEGGNAIYCCALGKQGSPWGIAADITPGFANATADLCSENKASRGDAPASCSGCLRRCLWILLWILCLEDDGSEQAGALA